MRPVVWFEIGVPAGSLAAAREFYGALFGWGFKPLVEYSPDYFVIDLGPDAPTGGALTGGHGSAGTGDGTWFAQARDPYGNRIGLWSANAP